MAPKALSEKEYDEKISLHGRVKRIGPYVNCRTKILHECLIHGERHLAYSSHCISGSGLACCGPASKAKKAMLEYDEKLSKIGKVKRIGQYKNNHTKIMHECLIHGLRQLATPNCCLSGSGLSCCGPKGKMERSKSEYDKKISEIGRVKRIGEYINSYTPILHECLIHKERHMCRPSQCLIGRGLSCCGSPKRRQTESKNTYDEKVKTIGKVRRIGKYINSHTPILHECLIHKEVHLASPVQCLAGSGLACCNNLGREKMSTLIKNKSIHDETTFYIYSMKNYSDKVKIGISRNLKERVKDSEYGELVCIWHFDNRVSAFVIEQACLRDVSLKKKCPEELEKINWSGRTEVREADSSLAICVVQFYVDYLHEVGLCEFIKTYLPEYVREIEKCFKTEE